MNENVTPRLVDLYGPVLAAIPDMFVLFDRKATVLDILHPDAKLVSGEPEILIGRTLSEEYMQHMFGSGTDCLNSVIRSRRSYRSFFCREGKGNGEMYFYEVSFFYLEAGYVVVHVHPVSESSVARIKPKHLRDFFSGILDHIAIPVSVKSVETGRYIYWNEKAEILGRTAGEMVGATEELFMSGEKARSVQQICRKLVEGKERQYEGIEKYMTNDGSEHTFMVTRTLFGLGKEKLIISSALDNSELKETQSSLLHTQDELAHKNMTLSSVLTLAKVIPWGCDLVKGTFYCDYSVYHPENAPAPDEYGRYIIPMKRYFAGIHRDYRKEAVRMIDELAAGKRDQFHETYLVHWFNDREWEWVQVQSSVAQRGADGRPVALIGSAQRITEQKRTELALRQAKEDLNLKNVILSSVLGIAQVIPWTENLQRGVFSCNYDDYHHESAAAADSEGHYTVSIQDFFDRIHPEYRAHVYDQHTDLIEGRINEFHEIYPIHWFNDREYEWVETQSSLFKYNAEGLLLIGSARVVTAQKRMEESLREAKEQAERSNTLKSAFLANMSHEIRTPLNAIVGFSELLAQAGTEEEKKEYLDIIQHSNALLLQLIGDILDLSKIEAGTLEFVFADHDLHALMEELEQTVRMKITDPDIEVACTHRQPGCTIHTDRGRLLQVLHNFINNAAKFTQKGHIHFGYRKHVDGRWYFYVEDTGCGISADKIDDVFERFVKLDAKVKGTGLGLAISKSIIERLGGEIGVYSAEGRGSTFWFLLPAGSVTASVSRIEPGDELPESFNMVPEQATILIAEDDSANYKLFEIMLAKSYTLVHAWNGQEAVKMFKECHPAMILMDIKMPEMDGYEATAAIRKLSPGIPIVAVTAFAYPEDMQRILACGFNGCLPKPVSAANLKKKISELCPSGKK